MLRKLSRCALISLSLVALSLTPVYARLDSDDPEIAVLEAHKGGVRSVVFAADGKDLVSLGKADGKVRTWDVKAGKELALLKHRYGILRMKLAPGEKLLAASDTMYGVVLCAVPSMKVQRLLKGHEGRVYTLCFSADGKLLATGDERQIVKIWDVESGKELKTLKPHAADVEDMAFSSDGKMLVTTARDGTLKVWNVMSGKRLRTIQVERNLYTLKVTDDGKRILGVDGVMARVWDIESGKEQSKLPLHTGVVYVSSFPACMFYRDQKTAAVLNGWGEVRLMDILEGKQVALVSHDTRIVDFAVCPKEKLLVLGDHNGAVKLWDVSGGRSGKVKPLGIVKEHTKPITKVAFSPAGKILVSASEDGTIRLWDIAKMNKK